MYVFPERGQWILFDNDHNNCPTKILKNQSRYAYVRSLSHGPLSPGGNKNCLCPWTHDLQDATKVNETYRRGICWVSADLPNSRVPFKNGEENK